MEIQCSTAIVLSMTEDDADLLNDILHYYICNNEDSSTTTWQLASKLSDMIEIEVLD